jgi:hypothetical protein
MSYITVISIEVFTEINHTKWKISKQELCDIYFKSINHYENYVVNSVKVCKFQNGNTSIYDAHLMAKI